MSLEPPQDNVPEQNRPLEEKEEEEEKKKKPVEEDQEEDDEEEETESKKKAFTSKRTSVTMYGIISGSERCEICKSAHKYFSDPQNWKYFTYKEISLMTDKGRKVAQRHGFTQMPFFRIRRKGENIDEWFEGFNSQEFEEMKKT